MFTIYIDNKPHQVKEGQNLLQACLSLGFDLPYFCWHPALHSVGACRQCAVKVFKDDKDTRGRITMSCMTPVAEGLRLSIDDPDARAFRSSVIEWLMLNHPHDCPVCDEGGECHLQDMTVMTGHTYRRARFKKRTHHNQDLGPFINHEMNRCIQCYRCVRFYRNYAGGRDLNVFASHDNVYFGRHEEGVLESEFSGNLIEVCPTGVFTDKTLKQHYTRKWDLQTAPSICVHCGIGCNTIPGERYGTLRRILNRYNHEVNGYFLCDRGRFGYEFVNSGRRIRKALAKSPSPQLDASHRTGQATLLPPIKGGATSTSSPLVGEDTRRGEHENLEPVSKESALKRIADILSQSKGVIGIGSPRASLESNFALCTLVGPDKFYSGLSDKEHRLTELISNILRKGPARTPSLHNVESADAIFILGEDVTNTAPMLALAVRQAAQNKQRETAAAMKIPAWDDNAVRNAVQNVKTPIYIASCEQTKMDDVATKIYQAAPDDIARLGFAIAHELDPNAPTNATLPSSLPSREGLQATSPLVGEGKPVPVEAMPHSGGEGDRQKHLSLAKEIATALKNAKRPVIVSGVGCMSQAIIEAAANVAWALCSTGKQADLCYTTLECNTMGLTLMKGKNTSEAFKALKDGQADTLIILENDLYRRADAKIVDEALSLAKNIIVIDHLINSTSSKADVTLPAATFAEAHGTLVNNEGRAQRFYKVFDPNHDIQESWKWIDDIMTAVGKPPLTQPSPSGGEGIGSLDDVIKAMVFSLPVFEPVLDIAPTADFRISGQKIPRQPHRYSGRTSMLANISVQEPKPTEDADSPLAFSMEGYEGQPPAPLIPRYWSPGWNSVQALNKYQEEIGGMLKGDNSGIRLIEPLTLPSSLPSREGQVPPLPSGERAKVRGETAAEISYFQHIPDADLSKKGEKPDLPSYRIFGSEELSAYSPAIAARMKARIRSEKP
jgi:NADH-quinone oxidoreductase subunit G